MLSALSARGTGGEAAVALLVYGLRADFYARCANYPQLRSALRNQVLVGPVTREEIREAILFPAQDVGLDIEPGLVDLLLRDLGTKAESEYEAERLPLLAHALQSTWQQRHSSVLPVAATRPRAGSETPWRPPRSASSPGWRPRHGERPAHCSCDWSRSARETQTPVGGYRAPNCSALEPARRGPARPSGSENLSQDRFSTWVRGSIRAELAAWSKLVAAAPMSQPALDRRQSLDR